MRTPKAPKPTAEQLAMEKRQTMEMDKAIEDEEERFKALSRGKLGKASLLSGLSATRQGMAGGAKSVGGGAGGAGSSLTGLPNPMGKGSIIGKYTGKAVDR